MSSIIIPARYKSTRFPGKVLANIGGKPMILRVAECCLKTKADNVIVVTDSTEVYEVCKAAGGFQVINSPDNIATGTDRVAFAANKIDDDIIINVQGDEPFIPPALIDNLIGGLSDDKSLKMITACTPFKADDEAGNPSAVKVVMDKKGYALYFSRCSIPFDRDNIEKVIRYRHIGIYGFRRDFLFEFASLERTPLEKSENLEQLRALENGVKIKVVKTDYNPVSVDTPADLEVAENYFNLNFR